MFSIRRVVLVPSLFFVCGLLAGLMDQAMAQGPALTPSDYGQWERLGDFELDPTGSWLAVSISRVDESRELRLHRADGTGQGLVLEHASAPLYSSDGRWVAYRKGVSPEVADQAEEPIPDRLGLVDLESGRDSVLFDVESMSFRADGAWLAALGLSSTDSVGADLIVLNPATGARTTVGNVAEFSWQDEGGLLAATLLTAGGAGNAVVVFDPDAATLRTLDARDAEYQALTWRDGTAQLGVFRSVRSTTRDQETPDLLVWDDAGSGVAPRVLEGRGRADLPVRLRVTEFRGIDFSEDGRSVFFGLRPWEPSDAAPEEAGGGNGADGTEGGEPKGVGPADVQVWHWNDDQILRAQEVRADAISRRTFAAVWHLDEDRVVMLGDDLAESVEIIDGGRWGLVPDYDPYRFDRRFGAGTADWYRVDTRSGERTLAASGIEFDPVTRADGGSALLFGDDQWSSLDLASLHRVPIAEGMSFTRSEIDHDYPGVRPSWGVGGWVRDTDQVLLYDKHDVWLARLSDNSLVRLTNGADTGRQYRIVNLDPEASFREVPVVDSSERLWLSVHDLHTKDSGYGRLSLKGELESLFVVEARVTGLTKAANAQTFALRSERWDDAPDVFVGGEDLDRLRQVTQLNPFQADFAWGRTELLGYRTDAGHDLQAILVYPANFEEGRRYPLILYQYERLSDNLHNYDVPSDRDYYNYQVWSQQGYFVLMPDIVYEPGRPGPSALDAVEHALDAAVATGHIDPASMGLIGHSWGGYQASYLPTRTNRFAASVAGAAITNFLSFMGAVHWNGGLPETGHWETGQARMAAPYWERLEEHLESSPANFVQNLETPMLLMHGDEDGTVDFYQGLEFYNYARRAGKEVVLLVYPGADHGLRDEAQQVDYHGRILEWFGHYLKGEPPAKWISDGESWAERGKRIGG